MRVETFEVCDLLQKRKQIKRILSEQADLLEIRLAILAGSTANELVDLLELHLLASGLRPAFYVSEYDKYYEESVIDPAALITFRPDFAYIYTSYVNLKHLSSMQCNEEQLAENVMAELSPFRQMWKSLRENVGCQVIQNTFELPPYAMLGNLDSVLPGGHSRFVLELNVALAREAASKPTLLLQDLMRLSSEIGLAHWFDRERWFGYKLISSPEGSLALARSLCAQINASRGRSRKVLVLDLDNTLWGGAIGDDGPDRIIIGRETPLAEAYTAFQEYCLALKNRGVILAVCSKNNEETAKQGFSHPDSVLKLTDFCSFQANWDPKHENLQQIAKELNLGIDTLVFVDDNPAERALVAAQLPAVAVPDVGSEPAHYPAILQGGRYFEAPSLTAEDQERTKLYAGNALRVAEKEKFADYGEYLDSLEMTAEIDVFKPVYLDRIAQLTNKTNQFNLTTRRYTVAEIQAIARNQQFIGIYGKLADRFGDNGLVSVMIGRKDGVDLHLELWLMSCRVLKRDMESAMLDVIVGRARDRGARRMIGRFIPTSKNGMVSDHYPSLGFQRICEREGEESLWALDLFDYQPRNKHIDTLEAIHG
jgi:FkbH-like protein